MLSGFYLLFPWSTLQTGFVLSTRPGFHVRHLLFSEGNASQLPKRGCISSWVPTVVWAFRTIRHTQ